MAVSPMGMPGFAQVPEPNRDSGIVVVQLGVDTTVIHEFKMEGNQFFSKILSIPDGLRYVEGSGEWFPNGNLKQMSSTSFSLSDKGDWIEISTAQLQTTPDSTQLQIKTGDKIINQDFEGHCVVTNSADAVVFQLFPFYSRWAPKVIGDSTILRHVTRLGARDFIIKRQSKNSILTRSSLMGPIMLYVDDQNRLVSVDALGSSLNFTSKVYREGVQFEELKKQFVQKQMQNGVAPPVTIRDTVQFKNDQQAITIKYSRPSARGRKVFGGIVPYGRFWRFGANAATEVTFSQPVEVDNKKLEAGSYSLFVIPHDEDSWELCFNSKTGIWGTEYDPSRDILRVPFRVVKLDTFVETLTIFLQPENDGVLLIADWEQTRLLVWFKDVEPTSEERIRQTSADFSKLILESNWQELSELYTSDAKLLPPGLPILEGRDAIRVYWEKASRITKHKVTPLEIKLKGDEAYDWGTFQGTSIDKNGSESSWKGKYIIIWKEVQPGIWKIYLDAWSRIPEGD